MKTRIVPILITLLFAAIASFLVGLALLTPANAASTPAMLTWSPSTNGTFDYGMVNVGQTASQEFTLTNSGSRASGMLSISLLDSEPSRSPPTAAPEAAWVRAKPAA